jgi:anti-anti-sigma factor
MSQQMVINIEGDSDLCILRVSGRIASGANDDYLQSNLRQIKAMHCRNILVDIRELHSVGSSGLGFFVDLHIYVTRNGNGRLVLVGPSPHVQEVLTLTRLSTVIPTVADIPSGMAFLAPGSKSAVSGI